LCGGIKDSRRRDNTVANYKRKFEFIEVQTCEQDTWRKENDLEALLSLPLTLLVWLMNEIGHVIVLHILHHAHIQIHYYFVLYESRRRNEGWREGRET
jgi:hypothetical protein